MSEDLPPIEEKLVAALTRRSPSDVLKVVEGMDYEQVLEVLEWTSGALWTLNLARPLIAQAADGLPEANRTELSEVAQISRPTLYRWLNDEEAASRLPRG